eukprot:scaffold9087_cov107-Cylindrotheca_fusiformis.AAC.1
MMMMIVMPAAMMTLLRRMMIITMPCVPCTRQLTMEIPKNYNDFFCKMMIPMLILLLTRMVWMHPVRPRYIYVPIMQDDDNEAFQTVFYEFPRISSAKTKSKSVNSDDDYDITDLDNIPMKFDEDDLDV